MSSPHTVTAPFPRVSHHLPEPMAVGLVRPHRCPGENPSPRLWVRGRCLARCSAARRCGHPTGGARRPTRIGHPRGRRVSQLLIAFPSKALARPAAVRNRVMPRHLHDGMVPELTDARPGASGVPPIRSRALAMWERCHHEFTGRQVRCDTGLPVRNVRREPAVDGSRSALIEGEPRGIDHSAASTGGPADSVGRDRPPSDHLTFWGETRP